jgi:hypothetical protein
MFRYQDGYITNDKLKVMDVQGNVDDENRRIISHKKNGGLNQQWDVVYVDEWKDEPVKGELNEKFGLYVERDFYIVSKLPSSRYLSVIDNRKIVIKTPHGGKQQVWYFDQKSLTIKTRLNNQSFDIKSSGKTKDFQIYSTNGRWW